MTSSMFDPREAVSAGCRKEPTGVGGRGQPSGTVGNPRGDTASRGSQRVPWAFAMWLATRRDIDTTLGDQRPPYKPPNFPYCYASDLKVPRYHKEAMRLKHAHLGGDLTEREFFGSLNAEACGPVGVATNCCSGQLHQRNVGVRLKS